MTVTTIINGRQASIARGFIREVTFQFSRSSGEVKHTRVTASATLQCARDLYENAAPMCENVAKRSENVAPICENGAKRDENVAPM